MVKVKPIPLNIFAWNNPVAALLLTIYEAGLAYYGQRQYVCGNCFRVFNVPIDKNMSGPPRCPYCLIEIDWFGTEEKVIKECPECGRTYDDLNLNLCPNQIHNPKSIRLIEKNIRK
jgi:DNA-directed RNA polymerase subunit RPC12/RpoP